MYTELLLTVRLKKETPRQVINILEQMLYNKKSLHGLSSHLLFKTSRWEWMFSGSSYYFNSILKSLIEYDDITHSYFLSVNFNIKNYGNEIELFIDWIMPFVAAYPGEFLGYSRYEEATEPTLIYKGE